MKLDASIDGSHLVVAITFANPVDETVYLMNWLMDWYGLLGVPTMNAVKSSKTAAPTRELAYACMGTHGELVLLNGEGPSPPDDVALYRPRTPYGTRLAKGETYRGMVRLPLPICEWYAYKMPAATPTVAVEVTQVRYRLELQRESSCMKPIPELPDFKGVYAVHGYVPEVHEAKAYLRRPITVLKRTDDFDRFG